MKITKTYYIRKSVLLEVGQSPKKYIELFPLTFNFVSCVIYIHIKVLVSEP